MNILAGSSGDSAHREWLFIGIYTGIRICGISTVAIAGTPISRPAIPLSSTSHPDSWSRCVAVTRRFNYLRPSI
jgi:hypothetical protein